MNDETMNRLKSFIQKYPVNEFGGVKRFLTFNESDINYLLKINTFKKVIFNINMECGTNIDYIHASKLLKKLRNAKQEKTSVTITSIDLQQPKKEEVKPTESKPTFKTQSVQTPSKKIDSFEEKQRQYQKEEDLYFKENPDVKQLLEKYGMFHNFITKKHIVRCKVTADELIEHCGFETGITSGVQLGTNILSYLNSKYPKLDKMLNGELK